MSLLVVEELSIHFDQRCILSHVSFSLDKGVIAGLLGRSGCGKTTLLRCIAGFHRGFEGKIQLNQKDISQIPISSRSLGFVFQDLSLFPHMSVEDNIGFGLHRRRDKKKRIDEWIQIFNIGYLVGRFPHELSGGEQQRVALARSMAPRPELILMDEPFSGLDGPLKEQLMGELRNIIKTQGQTVLFVTHSQTELFQLSDQGGVLIDGTLHQWGTPRELYNQPMTPEVASFIGLGCWIDIYECKGEGACTRFGLVPWEKPILQGEKIFIRPEQVRLTPLLQEAQLYVGKIQYQGSHQLVEICCRDSGESLLVRVENLQFLELHQCVQVEFVGIKAPIVVPMNKI